MCVCVCETELLEVGRATHYGWHHSLDCPPRLYEKERNESSPSTHYPFSYGLGMISCFKILLLLELRH